MGRRIGTPEGAPYGRIIVGPRFSGAGTAKAPYGIERLRQPEVQDLDDAIQPQLDVGRLEVAMDDALLVRGVERAGNLPRNRQSGSEGNRPLCNREPERSRQS